jgi:hypothetical protein
VGGGGGEGYLLRGVVSYSVSMWDFIVAKEGSKKKRVKKALVKIPTFYQKILNEIFEG